MSSLLNKINIRSPIAFLQRCHSTQSMTANEIRQTFLDYFLSNDHAHIRSSSVKPFCDPTLEFVNAGMNQFKNVFLGIESVDSLRSCNSQKCIRVGGKHNDLNSVGYDTYHHTFFEMLGNWSFNDYFKKDACILAWNLITKPPYSLDPNRIYVTYFGGDESAHLSPDLETKEIWRDIGVLEERILPFGMKDNFWEMGLCGPCGPCTEIHYDHLGTDPRPLQVNAGLPDLTELWNLVFIQYNRLENGSLEHLKKHFVDTGMGLERLVALIQGKSSNYDTDLFAPLFKVISKSSNLPEYKEFYEESDEKGINTAYRILADHSRMFSVAIADNIFPDTCHGLRRVIRKSFIVAESFVPGNSLNLMIELSRVVADSFSVVFPEITNNMRQIEFVLKDELNVWKYVQEKVKEDWSNLLKSNPKLDSLNEVQSKGLVSACKELQEWNINSGQSLPAELSLILYDRHGLNQQIIQELARINGLSVNIDQLKRDIAELKDRNKVLLQSAYRFELPQQYLKVLVSQFPVTDDLNKHSYTRNSEGYTFDPIISPIQTIIVHGEPISKGHKLRTNSEVGVLLAKTNCWSFLKGDGDRGVMNVWDSDGQRTLGSMTVDNVVNQGGYVFHFGTFQLAPNISETEVAFGKWEATLSIDKSQRLSLMRNTTVAHLVNIALRQKFISKIESLLVSTNYFSTKFSIYGQEIKNKDIQLLEDTVNSLIESGINIEFSTMSTNDILKNNNINIPGYINPNAKYLSLISCDIDNNAIREITAGPIVLSTSDVGKFCFTEIEVKNRRRELTLTGTTGPNVPLAFERTNAILSEPLNETVDQDFRFENKVSSMKSLLRDNLVPWSQRSEFVERIELYKSIVKKRKSDKHLSDMSEELKRTLTKKDKYLVYYAGENCKLEKLTRLCPELPLMLFAYNKDHVTVRCCVPKGCKFTAEQWVSEVAGECRGEGLALKGHDPATTYSLRPLNVPRSGLTELRHHLERAAKATAHRLTST